MKKIILLSAILISVFSIQLSLAAPSLTITKPPVIPNPSWTGPGKAMPPVAPSGDPHAEMGQWFVDRGGTIFTNRTHEFYDNVTNFGGGYMSCTAIFGFVSAITYQGGPGTPITAFDIDATIFNDIPALSPWASGNNSHDEQRLYNGLEDQKMEGPLLDVKLAAEFSVDDTLPYFPPAWVPPYTDRQPYIVAKNHDQLAWYCWTDDPEAQQPPGNFHVPTWDFGSIPMGGSANRIMSFAIPTPLPVTDPRYTVITNSYYTGADVLINRTTSLKISDWIEDIYLDTGVPYPDEVDHSSDVSVFHNIPEPGMFAGIALSILAFLRKFMK